MLQWYCDHTGTHSHTGKPEYHPGTQTGIVMEFTLFYVFLLMINTTFFVYLSETVLLCISFLSILHHDGMVHSNTTECTMLSSF